MLFISTTINNFWISILINRDIE